LRLPGATYFFTLCLEHRGSTLLIDQIALLRAEWRQTMAEFPVAGQAAIVLPDHLHAIWTEPEGSETYSERWRRIEARFSYGTERDFKPRDSLRRKCERGVWQRRFWEHAIRSEQEWTQAMEYLRLNPLKHGLVSNPVD